MRVLQRRRATTAYRLLGKCPGHRLAALRFTRHAGKSARRLYAAARLSAFTRRAIWL